MTAWLLRNSLLLASLGVMICSAGVDGAYMAKLMPPILGYALNAVSDISAEVLIYWYARLKQYPKGTKRHKMAWGLLVGEVFLTGFAWLFGWRQLLPIVTALEGAQVARWLAPVLAAFTPTLLIAAGYAQALLAGRIESEKATEDVAATEQPHPVRVQPQSPVALPAFTPHQLAQIERVVAVHTENEAATLRDLRVDGLIGSDTTASRARNRAIAGGYLVETVVGFSPNGKEKIR